MQSVPSMQVRVEGQEEAFDKARVRVENEGREDPVVCPVPLQETWE